jgi:hypothetical protein
MVYSIVPLTGKYLSPHLRYRARVFMRTAAAICLLVAVTAPTLVVIQGTPSFATEPAVAQAAAPQAPPSEATPAMESWRRQMVRTPFPKPGCYTSGYPETEWREVPCSTAEARPHPTNGDYSARVSSGSILSATGLFDSVTGANGETDSQAGANQFSLQLNTNSFDSPLCDKGNSGCAWQQYIYDSPGNVYIQYWLINNKQPCPSKSWKYNPPLPRGVPGRPVATSMAIRPRRQRLRRSQTWPNCA